MKKQLLWVLCVVFVIGALILFWSVNLITEQAEQSMSYISKSDQQTLISYGRKAETLYQAGQEKILERWLQELRIKEDTWAAVVESSIEVKAGSDLPLHYTQGFSLGRSVEWKIHLYFKANPTMDIPFADGKTHFLIQLPARMRPGNLYPYAQIVLQVGLPLILLSALAIFVYGYLMSPLRQLQRATRAFSQGELDARTQASSGFIGWRNDEITRLGVTFNDMASRTARLIRQQRELLSDLSHELRTPLARLGLALTYMEQGACDEKTLRRIRWELQGMEALVEDSLTLGWLTNEEPSLRDESVELDALLDVICQDAGFEYPGRIIELRSEAEHVLHFSNQRALSQAFENLVRNALKHTSPKSRVEIVIIDRGESVQVDVQDEGNGVPTELLDAIFRPFFQVSQSRSQPAEQEQKGYGLGLAIAKRQIQAVGGQLVARNRYDAEGVCIGLIMTATLPKFC